MTRSTITPPIRAINKSSRLSSGQWLLKGAAVGYSVVWIAGLLLASSSTDVTSSGGAIVRADAPQAAALTFQFLLTEGVAALALLVVVIGFWRATARGASRIVGLVAGVAAVAISLSQTVLGVCLIEIAVRHSDATLASSLTVSLNELDGVKMLLLAFMALAFATARWRRRVRLPIWLLPTGIVTGVALVASAIGYLTGSDAFAAAAWISLPLLLIFVTAVGLCLKPDSLAAPIGVGR